jgi:hypothetical protein
MLGNCCVWLFLALGLIAATSLYVWPVGKDAAADSRFEIGAATDGAPAYARLLRPVAIGESEIAAADAPLDPPTLAAIRDAGVKRVIVKHSDALGTTLANWTGKWLFLASALGIVGGAMLLRAAARAEVARSDRTDRPTRSAEDVAGAIRAAIADLRAAIPSLEHAADREDAIVAALGEVQAELVPAFVDTRPILIGKRGMGGFATVMDKFAAMERQINRSWSAAADRALPESLAALDQAAIAADELARTLGLNTSI